VKNRVRANVNEVATRGLGLGVLSLSCLTLAFVMMQSCKQQPPVLAENMTVDDKQSDTGVETLTAVQNTTLKSSLLQSAGLGAGAVCPIPQGTTIHAEAIKAEGIDHWRVFQIFEVKLPNGETGRRSRESNESDSQTQSPQEAGAPVAAATPVATPSATPTSTAALKNPAQLLGCELLNGESLLVFAPHFNRLLRTKSPVIPSVGTSSGEIDSDNQSDFVWPTRGRKIRSDSGGAGYFGAPRVRGSHQGLDIVAAVGEPIYASRAGTIIDPAYEASYGRVLDVKHQGGYLSRYAHLNSFNYSHGAYVEKGQRIAVSGRSGNASGSGITPHLHFEIRLYGRLMNPSKLLP
jgi:murein DD-endopeptidase MepM/ murein hydrolase activator NlpD